MTVSQKQLKELVQLAQIIASQMASKLYMERDELESHLLERLAINILPKLGKDRSWSEKVAFVRKSYKGYCLNFYRDNRYSVVNRKISDMQQCIRKLLKQGLTKPYICIQLEICPARYDWYLSYTHARHQLEDWQVGGTNYSDDAMLLSALDEADQLAIDEGRIDELSADAVQTLQLLGYGQA